MMSDKGLYTIYMQSRPGEKHKILLGVLFFDVHVSALNRDPLIPNSSVSHVKVKASRLSRSLTFFEIFIFRKF
jgi:hypothetical protein